MLRGYTPPNIYISGFTRKSTIFPRASRGKLLFLRAAHANYFSCWFVFQVGSESVPKASRTRTHRCVNSLKSNKIKKTTFSSLNNVPVACEFCNKMVWSFKPLCCISSWKTSERKRCEACEGSRKIQERLHQIFEEKGDAACEKEKIVGGAERKNNKRIKK